MRMPASQLVIRFAHIGVRDAGIINISPAGQLNRLTLQRLSAAKLTKPAPLSLMSANSLCRNVTKKYSGRGPDFGHASAQPSRSVDG